jgi:hypothetical protein
LTEAAAEPANKRDRRGGGAPAGWGVAAACGSGGLHKTSVVCGAAEVGDVLLSGDGGELGMHGCTSCSDLVLAL